MPSFGPWRPTLPWISQLLPLTSINESAALIPVPSSRLPITWPPVVPSLMSMVSEVVPLIVLPCNRLWSLRSGWPPLMSGQLLIAEPT